ncbi:hypothetical protein AGMMS50293_04000 [Spirochaetia bacterium]|nr:hypothetical protein AGMMS50293_04000 [Spirochaetia bacterium]
MAKNLVFSIKGADYEAAPVKVDRKKLYGWSETKALDDQGNECVAVSIDESGALIIPKGGLGMGILSPKGAWVERSSLKALTLDGKEAALVPSSYDAPIPLDTKVTVNEYLDHSITAFYQLEGAPPELLKAVGGDIYTFIYNLRADYEGSPAFLLESEGSLYMLLGYKSDFEMLGLAEAAVIDEEADGDEEDESDEIDFSMF